jgi:charged multivesicular body protein 4
MSLKRKKAYEEQINKLSGSRTTLETQVMTIENANVNKEAFNALKTGADALKGINGAMDVDKVDSTMDDIREQMDIADEISNAISQPVNFGAEFDEDELNEELELLEQEELDAKLLDTGLDSAPAAPSSIPGIFNLSQQLHSLLGPHRNPNLKMKWMTNWLHYKLAWL